MIENMNDLVKLIIEKSKIANNIQSIEGNIRRKYVHSIIVFVAASFVLMFAITDSITISSKFRIFGLLYGGFGYCLSIYLIVGAYQIKKKLNLLLEEMEKERGERKDV